jgi:hypothetical protein
LTLPIFLYGLAIQRLLERFHGKAMAVDRLGRYLKRYH